MLVLRFIFNFISDTLTKPQDPRTQHLPLVKSPIPILLLIISYLYFIQSLGPKLMKNRRPFNLKKVINVYNVLQILINLYLATIGLYNSYLQSDFNFFCQPIHGSLRPEVITLTYMFYLSRIFDLFDTIFFVLRKKDKQISFLHLYHHAGVVFGCWVTLAFLLGSHVTFLGVINSWVHVFMYSYYFLTSFKPELKASIWWKRYLTQVQLIQFAILVTHFSFPIILSNCNFPKILSMVGLLQNLFMFILFMDFYIKAYHKKSKQPAAIVKEQTKIQ